MPPHRPLATARRGMPALGVLAAVLALGACDLRLESPPPTEPAADAAEQVRERTVDDALALAAAARAARTGADDATAAVLDDVAGFSAAHADQLGGVYDSGLPKPTGTPTPTPVTATAGDVLDELRAGAGAALDGAGTAPDGGTARLLAAIGVARDQLADRLAAALGEPAPVPTAAATPTPEVTAATPTAAAPAPSGPALVDGLTADQVAPLVLAHDQAGFGFEVIAAKLDGDARQAAYAASVTHRAAAETWARRAGLAATEQDPRRAVYTLPAGIDQPDAARALGASLETGVADAAGAALVHAPPDGRAELVDELRTAAAAAVAWGGAPSAFPGLPELPNPAAG